MATDHGVAARFYLLVVVFCRSGIFCLGFSTLTNAAIWPGGLWNGAAFKFLRGLTSDRGTALSAQCAAGYRARARGTEESPLSTELYRPPLGNSWEGQTPSGSLFQKDARGDELTNLCKSGHAPSRCLPGLKG